MASSPPKHRVTFQPAGRRGLIDEGTTLIEASLQLGANIEALCGGMKICGKCRVRIEDGARVTSGLNSSQLHAGPWKAEEEGHISPQERDGGFRLACAAQVHGDLVVFVPEESRRTAPVITKDVRPIHIQRNPAVKLYPVQLSPPCLENPTGDFERLCNEMELTHGLTSLTIDWAALRRISETLRAGQWTVTAALWKDREVIDILPGIVQDYYGMAVDVGTTTMALYLCNLRTMEVIATESMMNPQAGYGEDVMSRITYHMNNPEGLETMRRELIAGLNAMISRACNRIPHVAGECGQGSGLSAKERNEVTAKRRLIMDMTVVGNTVMHHILLGLDPQVVGIAPFTSAVGRSLDIRARDLGMFIGDSAYVHVLPNQAGFVGADNVAVILAEEPHMTDELQLIIDIGTNGELVLGNNRRMISCSCATGPALEGAHISFGMRAAPGVIERVVIDPDTHEVDYKLIGRRAWKSSLLPGEIGARGICGSGILDLFAELYLCDIITGSGRFNGAQKSSRFRRDPDSGIAEFVVAWADETTFGKDLVITQKDVRQIQLAKAAIYSGCKLLMRRMGVDRVDAVKIAGAFGNHVDKLKVMIMGMLPDCEPDRVSFVGNAAGDGARVALLNHEKRREADHIARNTEHLVLTLERDFQQEFTQALHIPHMKDRFPLLEGLGLIRHRTGKR
ncbi:MAG: ASKHA domain-containing protein [Pseudomonadota bacterium]